MEKKSLILGSVLTIVCLALVFSLGVITGKSFVPEPEIITKRDTTTIFVPVEVEKPVPKYITKYKTDTVEFRYTEIRHDTVKALFPMERRVYAEDSLYRAVVTGYNPVLESLTIYPTITTITIHDKVKTPAPRFSFGVTLGPSMLVTPSGDVHAGAGVTAGLQYRF